MKYSKSIKTKLKDIFGITGYLLPDRGVDIRFNIDGTPTGDEYSFWGDKESFLITTVRTNQGRIKELYRRVNEFPSCPISSKDILTQNVYASYDQNKNINSYYYPLKGEIYFKCPNKIRIIRTDFKGNIDMLYYFLDDKIFYWDIARKKTTGYLKSINE